MDLTSLIERYRGRFEAHYASSLNPHQRQALDAVLACRTERYGEMRLSCEACHWHSTRYHSCGHRFCHRCQNHETTRWLQRQSAKLLPVAYFMVTFTLPAQLRELAWQHQSTVYAALFDCAVRTLKDFGANDKQLGVDMGMTAVLHTHSRRLDYHPHVHLVVPGGGVNSARKQWIKKRGEYLFNERALAKVFRARVCQSLEEAGLTLPQNLPAQWIVDCRCVGKGLPALKYLSRYLYRGVIDENNVTADDGTQVTFRYRDAHSGHYQTRTLNGETFVWLLFQHVLPKGFRRVRDYGFLHANARRTLRLIQLILRVVIVVPPSAQRPAFLCRQCRQPMRITAFIRPAWRCG